DADHPHGPDLRDHAGLHGRAHPDRGEHVRGRFHRLRAADRLGALLLLPEHAGLCAVRQLRPVGDSAVHPDGALRHQGRHQQGAVRIRGRGDGPLQGRACHGFAAGLRGVWRDQRLFGSDGRHHHQRGPAGDAAPWLLGPDCHRDAGSWRHARDPAAAFHRAGDLRHPDRAEHQQAVRRGHPARHHRHGGLHGRRGDLRSGGARPCTRRRRRAAAAHVAGRAGRGSHRDHLPAGVRRHLRRPVHAHGRRRCGGGHDLPHRAVEGRDDVAEVQGLLLRHRGQRSDDLPDLPRRGPDELRAGADAGAEPAGLGGGQLGRFAAAGGRGDPAVLRAARRRDGRAVDAAADHPDLLPHHHGPGFRDAEGVGRDLVRHHGADDG
ncbi:MAG: TRAP dicarboxylate transporter, DctM subunit, unknown substrate 3, partial [uncultured Ramlibacter sp.]